MTFSRPELQLSTRLHLKRKKHGSLHGIKYPKLLEKLHPTCGMQVIKKKHCFTVPILFRLLCSRNRRRQDAQHAHGWCKAVQAMREELTLLRQSRLCSRSIECGFGFTSLDQDRVDEVHF